MRFFQGPQVSQLVPGFLALLVAVVLASGSIALASAAHGVKDPSKASAVSNLELEKALRYYRNLAALSVDFKMTKRFKDIPTTLNSEGSFRLVEPGGFTWSLKKPSVLLVEISKDDITITTGAGNEAKTQRYRREQMGQMGASDVKKFHALTSWLSLDAKRIAQDYNVAKIGGEYEFTPKEKGTAPFSILNMKLRGTGDLERLTITESSGDTMELKFGRPTLKHHE